MNTKKRKCSLSVPVRLAVVLLLTGHICFAQNVPNLFEVRKIYIEEMSNDLDQYIRAEITKQFKGRITVVLKEADADAIMIGTGEKKDGVAAVVTGRYLGLHGNATGSFT